MCQQLVCFVVILLCLSCCWCVGILCVLTAQCHRRSGLHSSGNHGWHSSGLDLCQRPACLSQGHRPTVSGGYQSSGRKVWIVIAMFMTMMMLMMMMHEMEVVAAFWWLCWKIFHNYNAKSNNAACCCGDDLMGKKKIKNKLEMMLMLLMIFQLIDKTCTSPTPTLEQHLMWDDIAILARYLLMLSFNNSLDGQFVTLQY